MPLLKSYRLLCISDYNCLTNILCNSINFAKYSITITYTVKCMGFTIN